MRITFLVPDDHASGGMRAVHEYARHLARRGHAVTILVGRSGVLSGRTGQPLRPHQVLERRVKRVLRLVRRLPWVAWRFGTEAAARSIAQAMGDQNSRACLAPSVVPRPIRGISEATVPESDALVIYDWSTAMAASSLPDRCGKKFYLVQAEEALLGAPRELAEAAYRLPYCKIVVSSWLKRMLEERYGQNAEGPLINGVDFEQFHPLEAGDGRWAHVGMIYWSAAYKGSRFGVQAFELARRECPDLQMLVFGREFPSTRLPKGARFAFDPPQNELGAIYSSCGIWLSPSLIEGGGMPVQEAMACNCAVVATDVGAVRDFAEDGKDILIVPPGDPQAMAAQIVRLARDRELSDRLSSAAAANIRKYTWDRATHQLEAVLTRHVAR